MSETVEELQARIERDERHESVLAPIADRLAVEAGVTERPSRRFPDVCASDYGDDERERLRYRADLAAARRAHLEERCETLHDAAERRRRAWAVSRPALADRSEPRKTTVWR